MSCLSCQLCHCNLASQTKTELIIYPNHGTGKNSLSLQDYTFKIRRNKRDANSGSPAQDKTAIIMDEKVGETMETISKIISVPSSYRIHDQICPIEISTVRGQIQWAQSQIASVGENKQNANANYESRSTMKGESESRAQQNSYIKLPTSKSRLIESKSKSSTSEARHLRISHLNAPNPQSSQVSEKNLTMILYEKENQQLREELLRLKQKQSELLAEQYKMKEKNNRELGHLKKRSQDLETRSSMRKKQLNELRSMLKLVERSRQEEVTGVGGVQG